MALEPKNEDKKRRAGGWKGVFLIFLLIGWLVEAVRVCACARVCVRYFFFLSFFFFLFFFFFQKLFRLFFFLSFFHLFLSFFLSSLPLFFFFYWRFRGLDPSISDECLLKSGVILVFDTCTQVTRG
jgi:hypothetical protein